MAVPSFRENVPVPSRRSAHAVEALIARNCHTIDAADFAGYGATFAETAVFDNRATGRTLRGREEIIASAVAHRAQRDAAGLVFRHYVVGTVVHVDPAGGVLAASTTLIVQTDQDGSRPFALLSCRDHVVVEGDGVPRIVRRRVTALVDDTTSRQDGVEE